MPTYKVTTQNFAVIAKTIFDEINKCVEGGPVSVKISRETRSDEQNRKLWPVLRDMSRQATIGGQKLSEEVWKHVLSAEFKHQMLMTGLNGALVVIPMSTSKMPKKEFSDYLEFIFSVGADPQAYGVETEDGGPIRWSDPSLEAYETK